MNSAGLDFQPGRLWSLWDIMQIFKAQDGIDVVGRLAVLLAEARVRGAQPIPSPQLRIAHHALMRAITLFANGGLVESSDMARRLCVMVTRPCTFDKVAVCFGQLLDLVRSEAGKRVFLVLSPDDKKYYEQASPFNREDTQALQKKFKDGLADIKNAGTCLALGQGTACVMHLARSMDVALQKLARRLEVTVNPRDPWGVILGGMKSKIEKMPDSTHLQKEKKDRWSEARALLFDVKSAWRDRPMHAK